MDAFGSHNWTIKDFKENCYFKDQVNFMRERGL